MIPRRVATVILGGGLIAVLAGLAAASVLLIRLAGELKLARALEIAPAALTPPPPPSWEPGRTRVLVAGDSRVALWDPRPDVPGADLRFSGIGGETTAELRRRLERDLPLYAPDRLVLAAGVNDLVAASLDRPRAPVVAAGLVANLEAVAAQARAAGAEVTLLTIPQPARPDLWRRAVFWSGDLYGLVSETNVRIRALEDPGAGVAVLDAAALMGGPPDGPLPAELASDTLHFSAEGYARLNGMLSEALRE